MEETGKWIDKFMDQPLFYSNTSKNTMFFYIIFWLFMLIRFTIMMIVNLNQELRLYFGSIFHPLGSISVIMTLAAVTFTSLTMLVHMTLFFWKRCALKTFLDTQLPLYQQQNHQPLKGDFRVKFLKLLKLTFIAIEFVIKISLSSTSLIVVYLTILCASHEETMSAKIIWLFWGLLHILFCFMAIPLIFWACGLWYVMEQHLIYQVNQLTHSIRNLRSPKQLKWTLPSISQSYVRLSISVDDFNAFSSRATFLLTLSMTILNACLLFSHNNLRTIHPVFGYAALVIWFLFSTTTISVLNTVAVMNEKSQELSKAIRSIMTQYYGKISPRNLRRLQIMLENTSDQRHSPLSLTNIDGQIYTKLLSTRYIFYSIRVISLLSKLQK